MISWGSKGNIEQKSVKYASDHGDYLHDLTNETMSARMLINIGETL